MLKTEYASVFARRGPNNSVNTMFFAAAGKKKHHNYRGFRLPRRRKHRYLRCFWSESVQTNCENTSPVTSFMGPQKCESKMCRKNSNRQQQQQQRQQQQRQHQQQQQQQHQQQQQQQEEAHKCDKKMCYKLRYEARSSTISNAKFGKLEHRPSPSITVHHHSPPFTTVHHHSSPFITIRLPNRRFKSKRLRHGHGLGPGSFVPSWILVLLPGELILQVDRTSPPSAAPSVSLPANPRLVPTQPGLKLY